MNLIDEPWIPIRRRDGGEQRISLLQIAAPEIAPMEVAAPRADFTSALYQLAIGLLQTAFAPRNVSEWSRCYAAPPTAAELLEAFAPWRDGFELDAETGPAFMQDLDPLLHAEPVEIAKLLIDTPGDKTVTDNNDLFLHAGAVQQLCPPCAAAALLALQVHAPPGGAGHRVSLRGGGPLTTLRLPRDESATLFQKLWSNVMPSRMLSAEEPDDLAAVLPWLGPTRTSEKGQLTTPEDAHPLQCFFSMPRRIRLNWKTATPDSCDVCGEHAEHCLSQYRTRPYGVNYGGAWEHPLTPYNVDPKQENPPISIKGQRGGIGYRQWLGLAIGDTEGTRAAKVVAFFNGKRELQPEAQQARLWCSGYDMDNMKARCWYDATVPLPSVGEDKLQDLVKAVKHVLECADEMAFRTRKQVGAAVHAEGSGDPAISQSFWHATERAFYDFLREAMDGIAISAGVGAAAKRWALDVRDSALEIFDAYVLAVPVEDGGMKEVVKARSGLERSFFGGKSRALWEWATRQEEAAE